ncbi:hypothetical protein R3W88_029510 [Solanum pinnatisectum]|uniref:Endonuclease/exonuclease/phosphatase domain-containing protein n=1 Tax=Solanum pinnatisectum TaxID=50273 RepID=A0AAV9K7A5_9SOLN|nr:hypothetical protein R3W88_029510 [Solanum pinnatisectum]
MLDMEGVTLSNVETPIIEEDDNIEDQVVPLSPSIHRGMPPTMREEAPNIQGQSLQTLYLKNLMTIDMQQNLEKKLLIKVPKDITKTSLNIRCYNTIASPKYVALLIPTTKGKQLLEKWEPEAMLTNVNLDFSLAPGGTSSSQEILSMKILLWNCRAIRMDDHESILRALDFTDVIQVPAVGYSGGITLFWRNTEITIEKDVLTEQEIHSTIEVSSNAPKFSLSIIYAKNKYSYRKMLWNSLRNVVSTKNGPWLVCGDFNEITNASEKLGGRPINNSKCSSFINYLDDMGMMDLGFTGQKYTWTIKHKNNKTLIMERLDRFLSNNDTPRRNKVFRFKTMWLRHPGFPNVVQNCWNQYLDYNTNQISFTDAVKQWNKEMFGNIFKQKDKILKWINGL